MSVGELGLEEIIHRRIEYIDKIGNTEENMKDYYEGEMKANRDMLEDCKVMDEKEFFNVYKKRYNDIVDKLTIKKEEDIVYYMRPDREIDLDTGYGNAVYSILEILKPDVELKQL